MKRSMISPAIVLITLSAACSTLNPPLEERRAVNAWMVSSLSDTAINRAIIVQHTLYPYHFDLDGETLNELGKHDLRVLAAHYKEHPGQLNLPRGNTAEAFYKARIATVIKTLADAGVEKDRITLADALPGGDGMVSERLLNILEYEATDSALRQARSVAGASTGGPS